jgi:hypothetical protein
VAPTLASVVGKLETPLGVITAMWNHAGRMAEAMIEENVAWPVLKGGEMADLIAYLLGPRAGTGPQAGPRRSGSPGARAAPRQPRS